VQLSFMGNELYHLYMPDPAGYLMDFVPPGRT